MVAYFERNHFCDIGDEEIVAGGSVGLGTFCVGRAARDAHRGAAEGDDGGVFVVGCEEGIEGVAGGVDGIWVVNSYGWAIEDLRLAGKKWRCGFDGL